MKAISDVKMKDVIRRLLGFVVGADGIHVTARAYPQDQSWSGNIGVAKVAVVTLTDGQSNYTLNLDARYLEEYPGEHSYNVGNVGVRALWVADFLELEVEDTGQSQDHRILSVLTYY